MDNFSRTNDKKIATTIIHTIDITYSHYPQQRNKLSISINLWISSIADLPDEALRGFAVSEQREQVKQVVAWLVVVAVLPHGHRAHLNHLVNLGK